MLLDNNINRIIKHNNIMPSFLSDETGKKTHVLLSIQEYEEIMEDLEDLKVIVERRGGETISHEELLKKYE